MMELMMRPFLNQSTQSKIFAQKWPRNKGGVQIIKKEI